VPCLARVVLMGVLCLQKLQALKRPRMTTHAMPMNYLWGRLIVSLQGRTGSSMNGTI